MQAAGEALLARYARIRTLTAAIRSALEQEQSEPLQGYFQERAAELDAIDALLAALDRAGGVRLLDERVRARAQAEIEQIRELDRRVQVLLSSGAQEVPLQLAQVRGSLARFGSYHGPPPDAPEFVDRRG